mgnify:CR=1 FL=1
MFNSKVLNTVGLLLVFLGLAMLPSCLWSVYYKEYSDIYSILLSSIITIIFGVFLYSTKYLIKFKENKSNHMLSSSDAFTIVTLTWLLSALFGALPFYLSNYNLTFIDSFFESMSGLTTTGATILGANTVFIEDLSHGLLFWRSFTQFIGGMGIILFTIAVLPILGMGGSQLFRAEVPGPTSDKLTPRIKETAKYLWIIYIGLIIIETLVLYAEGVIFNIEKLTFFNAICHSMTTIATGGFSTFNNSILGFENDIVSWTIMFFMFLGATNFYLHFLLITKKTFDYFNDTEFKFYISIIIIIFIFTFINISTLYGYTFKNITASLFNTITFMSTTGYTLHDYGFWPPLSQLIVFFMFFIGGMSGSTTGGIKIIRTLVVLKYIKTELRRLVHPRGLYHVKIGKNLIDDDIVRNTLGFYLFYILIFISTSLIISTNGFDIVTSLSISASSIGNIGPGLGAIGPSGDWSLLNTYSKLLSMFCMLLGRLEIFTVMVLLSKIFWK